MNSGVKLWNKAKKIIPGGNQLLSKRSEMFLPDQWPSYYKRAKGVEIWDLDNNHYYDMGIMGIGSCVLGYSNDKVNEAVINAVKNGCMSTLNCHEEVELAEELIRLHPWAGMVRYARSGGEACTIAIRIARAFSKKDCVAFCGYHGWHDWYLAANIADSKNLDGQLLPGLSPLGVPRSLKDTSMPFNYGNIDELKKIIKKSNDNIGVIIMEVERHKKIDLDFLKEVKEIAKKIGAVLIYDEVSSGFRVNIGGMHILYGINPDILVLGKALGNGHPIGVIIGKKEVMDIAQESFISSTYWTERVGFAASIAVLKEFKEKKVIDYIINIGKYISKGLSDIFTKYNLNIEIVGLPSVPIMIIKEKNPEIIKSVFIQEMMKQGFLVSTVIYVSSAHTKEIVDKYLSQADTIFKMISENIISGSLDKLLEGPVCHTGFKRLN